MNRRILILFSVLLLARVSSLDATGAPQAECRPNDAVVYAPQLHFRWELQSETKIDDVHRIQIARDKA